MKIIEEIGEAAMLEQLAEECTENLQRQHSKWQGSYEKRIRHL